MMRKVDLTATAAGLVALAAPAAQAAPHGVAASAATPFYLASAAMFIPGLQLILGLLRGNRGKVAAAA